MCQERPVLSEPAKIKAGFRVLPENIPQKRKKWWLTVFIIVCKNIYKYYQDIVMLLLIILSLPDAFILLQCQSETNNTK